MKTIRFILLGLVLVLVAMASALATMRLAIHGREVAVPKLVGMTTAQAESASAANGLRFSVEDRFYSGDVPEGRIVSQVPAPGTRVRRGWEMRVAESLGPQRAMVPDVVGGSERAAEINIRRRGLEIGTVALADIPGYPPDEVIGQSPLPNAGSVASPKVNLLVNAPDAQPTYLMPDFVGKHLGDAARSVDQAGMKLGNGEPDKVEQTEGYEIITGQSPAPGQKVTAGTVVVFQFVHPETTAPPSSGAATPPPTAASPPSTPEAAPKQE